MACLLSDKISCSNWNQLRIWIKIEASFYKLILAFEPVQLKTNHSVFITSIQLEGQVLGAFEFICQMIIKLFIWNGNKTYSSLYKLILGFIWHLFNSKTVLLCVLIPPKKKIVYSILILSVKISSYYFKHNFCYYF